MKLAARVSLFFQISSIEHLPYLPGLNHQRRSQRIHFPSPSRNLGQTPHVIIFPIFADSPALPKMVILAESSERSGTMKENQATSNLFAFHFLVDKCIAKPKNVRSRQEKWGKLLGERRQGYSCLGIVSLFVERGTRSIITVEKDDNERRYY